jgi:hypothetical protein
MRILDTFSPFFGDHVCPLSSSWMSFFYLSMRVFDWQDSLVFISIQTNHL